MSDVTSWTQTGQLSLWHYTENERNYPGWHLSADSEGSLSLATLLRAFEKSRVAAYRTVAVTSPSTATLSVPNNCSGRAAFRAPSRWRIRYLPDADSSRTWIFAEKDDAVELALGSDGLDELLTGIEGIPAGKGDYSIGHDGDEQLWFWWWPK